MAAETAVVAAKETAVLADMATEAAVTADEAAAVAAEACSSTGSNRDSMHWQTWQLRHQWQLTRQ